MGVLLKVQLATEGDRPAAVIGDEAYSSHERGWGILVGGAGRENIGEYRHDSRSHRWARNRKRRNNKSPGLGHEHTGTSSSSLLALRFGGLLVPSRGLRACILRVGRSRRRNRLGLGLGLSCRDGSGRETPRQSAGEESGEDSPRSLSVHGRGALRTSNRTSMTRPALLHLLGGPCGLGHWMSRGTNCLFCGPNCFSPPRCAGVWASAK